MKIVSISWVRNEADIIEDVVRHHVDILDRMVIIENASTDATPSILQSLMEEGLPLDVRHSDSAIHNQGEQLTAVMHELSQESDGPDWILPLDADEFLGSTIGSVQDAFAHLPPDAVVLLPWHTYVPTLLDDETGSVPARIQHRRAIEHPQYRKVLIPRACHAASCRIPLGSHALESNQTVPIELSQDLFLAHFPVRSPAQIRRKITQSWERHSANPQRTDGQNFHWERLYDEMKNGTEPSAERLQKIALYYAADPQEKNEIVFDPITHPLQ